MHQLEMSLNPDFRFCFGLSRLNVDGDWQVMIADFGVYLRCPGPGHHPGLGWFLER
jgi:hypothetical protein